MAPYIASERTLSADEPWDLGTLRLDPGATVAGKLVDRDSTESIADATIRDLRELDAVIDQFELVAR